MSTATSIVTGVDSVSVPTRDLTGAMDFYATSSAYRVPACGSPPERIPSAPSSRRRT
jgi:hypothetical protein